MRESEIAYLAGLFDGEGHIQYKQYNRKRSHNKKAYPTWSIRMEMSMTDESVIRWFHEKAGCGTVGKRKFKKPYAKTWKQQWRWRCCSRDAWYVSNLLWSYAKVKLHKIEQIIDHYADCKKLNKKIINLKEYKEAMSLE